MKEEVHGIAIAGLADERDPEQYPKAYMLRSMEPERWAAIVGIISEDIPQTDLVIACIIDLLEECKQAHFWWAEALKELAFTDVDRGASLDDEEEPVPAPRPLSGGSELVLALAEELSEITASPSELKPKELLLMCKLIVEAISA